jgi:hypothetical protein
MEENNHVSPQVNFKQAATIAIGFHVSVRGCQSKEKGNNTNA